MKIAYRVAAVGLMTLAFSLALRAHAAEFELAARGRAATILVPPGEPECVRLAAADLVGDVAAMTGEKPKIIERLEDAKADCVVLVSADQPESIKLLKRLGREPGELTGRWEAYRVELVETDAAPIARALVIVGSDHRGTMFGLYALIEKHLGVEPLYFWTDRPPKPCDRLAWSAVKFSAGEPTFRYRGWFINDEDLLTDWHPGGGRRDIDYPFYDNVMAPDVSARVFEAMLRLRMNLVIPSSFIDVRNPAEARLIEDATRRGLLVTQHHAESLGVSAFTFRNYWKSKGEDVPYSFVSQRDKFEAAWREYARLWSRYPGVVWQLGLRGVADRPVWVSDPNVPKTDEARGKLISDAIARQWEIVRSVDKRPQPPATTTLWMEGADLHRKGVLTFPQGVTVVFADNSPGWQWQNDFFQVRREAGRPYGVYYHHALWGEGPHLVQAPSPERTHNLFRLVVEQKSNQYALLNVGNVREFVLGIEGSAQMLRDFAAYDPERFLKQWCAARFPGAAEEAEVCYRRLFDSYLRQGGRGLLDGELVGHGKWFYAELAKHAAESKSTWGEPEPMRTLLTKIQAQRAKVEQAGEGIEKVLAQLDGADRQFFEVNFVCQQRILLGLLVWNEIGLQAGLASAAGDREKLRRHLSAAEAATVQIRTAQKLSTRGKWQDWYRGEKKMNLAEAERLTREAVRAAGGSER